MLKLIEMFIRGEDNKSWFNHIWTHQIAQFEEENHYYIVDKKYAVYATILLLLNRWHEEDLIKTHYDLHTEVAWRDQGNYYTDFGTGHAFETLFIYKGKLYSYEDRDL